MIRILNILMVLIIILFIFFTFKYYSSNKNINTKDYNRLNIDLILKDKTSGLPILKNNTNNIIEFNNSLENEIDKYEKKRKFWDLLKNK
tara:strand:+ start:147 stop:413 length:267 start_codon:yes stop_codon:yes gene_type:complete